MILKQEIVENMVDQWILNCLMFEQKNLNKSDLGKERQSNGEARFL